MINPKPIYPSFGEPIGQFDKMNCKQIVLLTVKITAALGVGAAVGAAVAGAFGVLIGLITAAAVCIIVSLALYIANKVQSPKNRLIIPDIQPQPLLGRYVKTDICLLNKAEESFQMKKELLSIAQSSIEIAPNFAGGDKFQEILDIIEERLKLRPQLKVHILVSSDQLSSEDKTRLKQLEGDYSDRFFHVISERIFSAYPFAHTEENHAKMLLVDNKYFVTGGSGLHRRSANSTPDYENTETINESTFVKTLPDCAIDSDIVGCGNITSVFRRQFFYLLEKWENRTHHNLIDRFFDVEDQPQGTLTTFHKHQKLISQAKVKLFVSGPEHRLKNPISNKIAQCIEKAKQAITIAALHFLPQGKMQAALKNRQVQVELISNGAHGMIPSIFTHMNRMSYDLVDKAYENERENTLYHRKATLFDNSKICIGSNNWGSKSERCDDEIMVVIKNQQAALQLKKALDDDKKLATEISGDALKSTRLKGLVPGKFFKLAMENFVV